MNSSVRVYSYCTGRPVRSTASATRSSVSSSCLPPNPPPTRAVNTRTRSGGSARIRASSLRTRNGTCVLVRITSRPSSSSQPMDAWVSSAVCATRVVCQRAVDDGTTSARAAAASPASTSPTPLCRSATTLRAGSAIRASGPLSPCSSGAPARAASSGSNDGGQQLVLDVDRAARRLGDGQGLGDDGGHPLATEPHDVVEQQGVVGVVEPVLVPGGRERHVRHVLAGEDQLHPRQRLRRGRVDARDPRVRVRAAQHREVQQARRARCRACRARHRSRSAVRPGRAASDPARRRPSRC